MSDILSVGSPLKGTAFFGPIPIITSCYGNCDIGELKLNGILNAMKMGNVEEVRLILSGDIRTAGILDAHGNTLLHMIMKMFQKEPDKAPSMVELLLEFVDGSMVHKQNTDGHTAFHYACKFDMLGAMTVLFRSGANPKGGIMQDTPHEPCKCDTTDLLKAFRGLSTDIAVGSTKTSTLGPNDKKEVFQQALHALIMGDKMSLGGLIREYPFLLSEGCGDDEATLLHLTVQKVGTLVEAKMPYGDMQGMMNFLLSLGANPNAPDKDGCTALHWAALGGLRKPTKSLIEKGANVLITDDDGNTPYAHALEMHKFARKEYHVPGRNYDYVRDALDIRYRHILDATLEAVKTEAEDQPIPDPVMLLLERDMGGLEVGRCAPYSQARLVTDSRPGRRQVGREKKKERESSVKRRPY